MGRKACTRLAALIVQELLAEFSIVGLICSFTCPPLPIADTLASPLPSGTRPDPLLTPKQAALPGDLPSTRCVSADLAQSKNQQPSELCRRPRHYCARCRATIEHLTQRHEPRSPHRLPGIQRGGVMKLFAPACRIPGRAQAV